MFTAAILAFEPFRCLRVRAGYTPSCGALKIEPHDLMNAKRSALITSALVVSMPCGYPG
jgi:hypothetical protein